VTSRQQHRAAPRHSAASRHHDSCFGPHVLSVTRDLRRVVPDARLAVRHARHIAHHPQCSRPDAPYPDAYVRYPRPTLGPSRLHFAAFVLHVRRCRRHAASSRSTSRARSTPRSLRCCTTGPRHASHASPSITRRTAIDTREARIITPQPFLHRARPRPLTPNPRHPTTSTASATVDPIRRPGLQERQRHPIEAVRASSSLRATMIHECERRACRATAHSRQAANAKNVQCWSADLAGCRYRECRFRQTGEHVISNYSTPLRSTTSARLR
jgi:hypothetical protein